MSITTTSGCTTAARRVADATPSAVATTSKPSSARSRATASRQIGWSSTTITVGGIAQLPILPSAAPSVPTRCRPGPVSTPPCRPASSSAPQSISRFPPDPRATASSSRPAGIPTPSSRMLTVTASPRSSSRTYARASAPAVRRGVVERVDHRCHQLARHRRIKQHGLGGHAHRHPVRGLPAQQGRRCRSAAPSTADRRHRS